MKKFTFVQTQDVNLRRFMSLMSYSDSTGIFLSEFNNNDNNEGQSVQS